MPIGQFPVKKQRILLINLYLNQIFNTILLNSISKQKDRSYIPSLYKNSTQLDSYSLPYFSDVNYKNDKQIISKVNSLLDKDKSISFQPCYITENYRGGNIYRRRKQKTIKKKNRNIKNKNSLKNKIKIKINKKIKKYVKKIIKKNNINNIKQQQQQVNKHKIKKFIDSKIHKKINKFKLNKTKYRSKNKNNHRKYTRKNY